MRLKVVCVHKETIAFDAIVVLSLVMIGQIIGRIEPQLTRATVFVALFIMVIKIILVLEVFVAPGAIRVFA